MQSEIPADSPPNKNTAPCSVVPQKETTSHASLRNCAGMAPKLSAMPCPTQAAAVPTGVFRTSAKSSGNSPRQIDALWPAPKAVLSPWLSVEGCEILTVPLLQVKRPTKPISQGQGTVLLPCAPTVEGRRRPSCQTCNGLQSLGYAGGMMSPQIHPQCSWRERRGESEFMHRTEKLVA